MTREEQIFKAAKAYIKDITTDIPATLQVVFIKGAEWSDAHQNHWHDAQGDDLPPIDKEVIVLRNNGQISFGHRPNPDGEVWKHADGTLEHVHFKTYEKGGWNIPDVKWWLDVALPKEGGDL